MDSPWSFRLTPAAQKVVKAVEEKYGVNRTSALEIIVRAAAEKIGIPVKGAGK